jgi:hypothetical protein
MMQYSLNGVHSDGSCQVLSEDSERVFCRWWRVGDDGNQTVLVVLPPPSTRRRQSSIASPTNSG